MEQNPIASKLCRKCDRILPATLAYFIGDKTKRSGLHSVCKDCNKESCKRRRDKNIDAARAAERERYYQPERNESTKRRAKESYLRNKEICIERASKRCRMLAELGLPRVVSERATINQTIRDRTKQRNRKSAEGSYAAEDIMAMRRIQGGLCIYCSRPISMSGPLKETVDHIIPLSRGGTHWPSNLVLACIECNLIKHNKPVDVFLRLTKRPHKETPIKRTPNV